MELKWLQQGDAELAQKAIDRLKVTGSGLPHGPGLGYSRRFLQNSGNVLIVATDAGAPIGFVLAYLLDRAERDRKMMLFYEIEVADGYRRRGVARAMVGLLKSVCVQRGVLRCGSTRTGRTRRQWRCTRVRAALQAEAATRSVSDTISRREGRPVRRAAAVPGSADAYFVSNTTTPSHDNGGAAARRFAD